MRLILWLGVVPLWYGLKLFYTYVVADRRRWEELPEEYRNALPLRIIVALILIGIGFWLFSGTSDYLWNR